MSRILTMITFGILSSGSMKKDSLTIDNILIVKMERIIQWM